jgi:hypothetical protein
VFGVVLELLIVEKQLLAGGEDEFGAVFLLASQQGPGPQQVQRQSETSTQRTEK